MPESPLAWGHTVWFESLLVPATGGSEAVAKEVVTSTSKAAFSPIVAKFLNRGRQCQRDYQFSMSFSIGASQAIIKAC